MRDANICRIYLRAFYISDITDLGEKSVEEWAKQEKRQETRTSKWKWRVQQSPPAAAWKHWQLALQCITSEDGDLFQHLGPWGDIKNSHQNTEWNLDAGAMTLYRHKEGMWTTHGAVNYGRIRFESAGVTMAERFHITHRADGTQRRRQIELSELHAIHSYEVEGGHNPRESIYTSEIEECFRALPKHVRRLVGNIPDIVLLENLDCTEPTDLIVATDGYILFGVGYHSRLVSAKDKHILLHGGGSSDGSPLYVTSYRSELGGICAGLAVIGVLARSGRINIRSVRLVCDKEAAVKWCNQKLTSSIYHIPQHIE
jgi:hypothetical protein